MAVLLSACADPRSEPSESGSIRLGIVGQALIEYDPRAHFESPLSSVLPILNTTDAVFTNLEVAVSNAGCACVPTRDDIFFHGAEIDVVEYLAGIGVSLLALSNNHSWDYGAEGILSTIAAADALALTHAGTGADVAEATAPAYLDVAGKRVALVSMATVNSPDEARATSDRPGVNMLAVGDSSDWNRNLAAVRAADVESDIVVVYQHFQVDAEPGWQEEWARATIEAGADVYVSHGEPTLKGVEVHRGGLILYGLGNFIFHTKTEVGRYPADVWESVIVEVSLGDAGLEEVKFTPLVLDEGTGGPNFLETRGYPEVAEGELGQAILQRLSALSLPYGTLMELRGGHATLRLDGSPPPSP